MVHRFSSRYEDIDPGDFFVEWVDAHKCIDVFYTPPYEDLRIIGDRSGDPKKYKTKEINSTSRK